MPLLHLGHDGFGRGGRVRSRGDRPTDYQKIRARLNGAGRGRDAGLVIHFGGGRPNARRDDDEAGSDRKSVV